jgi:segregation and condensation protein A
MEHTAGYGGIDLDAAAEFVYTAALLIQIKTRMLLPRPEVGDDGEPVDPRRELVERLIEYMRYKEAAGYLDGRWEARQQHATRGEASAPEVEFADVPIRAGLFDLLVALAAALRRGSEAGDEPVHDVSTETYALDEQREWVLGALASPTTRVGSGAAFARLVAGKSRAFIIVTFLAVLDLLQSGALRLVLGASPEDFGIELSHVATAA